MFDFLKNLTKSDEAKRQEAFSAYLDGSLSSRQQQEFEQQLAEDADLRAEMELAQLLRQQMQEMPRRSLPRSFTLDATLYGKPQKEPLVQAYPFLRAATVMTAFFFVIALSLSVYSGQSGGDMAAMAPSAAQTEMDAAPLMEAPAAEADLFIEEATEEAAVAKIAEEPLVVETVVVEEEAMADESLAEEAFPETALTASATAVPEMESADMALEAGAAPDQNFAPTTTALPTATVSSLPRAEAAETAVPRLAEPSLPPSEEIAGNTAAETNQPVPVESAQPARWSLSLSQWLLLGLGLLFFLLLAATLLVRRKF